VRGAQDASHQGQRIARIAHRGKLQQHNNHVARAGNEKALLCGSSKLTIALNNL
jgi:hypothetical protein